jgi:hypothetical protein
MKVDFMFRQQPFHIKFNNLPVGVKHDIRLNGVKINMFCGGFFESGVSLAKFMLMFAGGD